MLYLLGLKVSMFLHTSVKGEVSVIYRPLTLLSASPAGFQNQIFWRLAFPGQNPWCRKGEWGLDLLLLEETGVVVISLQLVDYHAKSMGPDWAASLPLLLTLLWLLF